MERAYPTAEELPGAASVRMEGLDTAKHVLRVIRQIHNVTPMDEEMIEAVRITHADIEKILRFFIEHDRIQLREVFSEGRPIDMDLPVPSLIARELGTRIAQQMDLISWVDEKTESVLFDKLASVYPNPDERIANGRLDLRERFRRIYWGAPGEHWRDEMTREASFYRAMKSVSSLAESGNNTVMYFFDKVVIGPIEEHLPEAKRRMLAGEPFEQLTIEQQTAFNAASMLQHYYNRISHRRRILRRRYLRFANSEERHVLYAQEKLFAEHKLELRGAESALLGATIQKPPFLDDTDLVMKAREGLLVSIVHRLGIQDATAIFGGSHDFWPQIQEWNRRFPDETFGLYEVTPEHYEEQYAILMDGISTQAEHELLV